MQASPIRSGPTGLTMVQVLGLKEEAERLNPFLGDAWPTQPYSVDPVATVVLMIEL